MNKKILAQEKEYLETVKEKIDFLKEDDKKRIKNNEKSISTLKKVFSDSFYDLHTGDSKEFGNEDEFATINAQIEHLEIQKEALNKEISRLSKQKSNPYFGRFDFQSANEKTPQKYYIGVGLIQNNDINYVYDWRADICSLYYEDQFGQTSYACPDGEIKGNLSLKRQYKIENGNLNYYIDSNMIIDDEILMEQLSKNATSKMHDIVSTIQKEQNSLIRSEDFKNIIVQGVAGSGKTSVALHRVSFLLYKYRDKLKIDDILILSPSELFSDYINDVLPSLGEEKPYTTTFYNMARRMLGNDYETREELLEKITEKQNQKDFENIAVKSSFEFLEEFKKFLDNDICNLFIPKTYVFGDLTITKQDMQDIYFNRLKNLPIYKRIDVLAEYITDRFKVSKSNHEDLVKRAKQILYKSFLTTDVLKIYNIFLRSNDLKEIDHIGPYDIAPILLIKENLFSLKTNYSAKYVIVDEMQDYTPCHFYLFDKIWKCGKLYLGDIYQSVDRTLSLDYLKLLTEQTKSKIKFLNKSYRSTLQISVFSQKILGKRIANNVNRIGEPVECIKTRNCTKAVERILAKELKKKQSIAIICKTKSEIKKLQKESDIIKKFKVLDELSTMSRHRKFITTPTKAKGVEFDCVIVPFADKENFNNELDKNLLYVSSTRALHKLYFVSDKKPSHFLTKTRKTTVN